MHNLEPYYHDILLALKIYSIVYDNSVNKSENERAKINQSKKYVLSFLYIIYCQQESYFFQIRR